MDGPSFDVDLDAMTLVVHRSDGQRLRVPLPEGTLDEEKNVRRFGWRASQEVLLIELPDGSTATVELDLGRSVENLLAGRSIVYLDQNQWSKVSAWRQGRSSVSEAEGEAARALVQLVEQRRIVLPASAGHFVETAPLYGTQRIELASTVLGLSRGWQMRSPLHLRVQELIHALRGEPPAVGIPFAPGADVFYARLERRTGSLPEPLATVNAELTRAMSIHAMLIDPETIEDPGGAGEAATDSWARDQARIARQLRADGVSQEMARRVTDARFVMDMRDDVARAGITVGVPPDQAVTRLLDPSDPIKRLPFLARFRELVHLRVRNAGQKWEGNDLIDLMFLGSAAAYADLVIGERATIGYLRQARSVPPGAELATNLAQGLTLLQEQLDR